VTAGKFALPARKDKKMEKTKEERFPRDPNENDEFMGFLNQLNPSLPTLAFCKLKTLSLQGQLIFSAWPAAERVKATSARTCR
jgi:hypothetical protein